MFTEIALLLDVVYKKNLILAKILVNCLLDHITKKLQLKFQKYSLLVALVAPYKKYSFQKNPFKSLRAKTNWPERQEITANLTMK